MPPSLIEKKTKSKKRIIAFNKSCGIGSMKHHVEALHFKLLTTYVAKCFVHDNVIGSQERNDEGGRLMQLANKHTKVVVGVIFSFFGSKTCYKRHDEFQKLFLTNLVLLTAKGYLPLRTCENAWMHRLVLRLDSKVMFPTQRTLVDEILLTMVNRCLNLYIQPLLVVTPTTMATFDLSMSEGQHDTFTLVIIFYPLIGSLGMSQWAFFKLMILHGKG